VSLHADAVAVLSRWAAPSRAQEELRERYLTHLQGAPDGMYRAHFPDHLTAGVLVVDTTGEQVLLNLHRKAQRWFAFGGHCEPADTTLAGAALREGREESGLTELRFDPEPAQLDDHLDVRYVAQAAEGANHATSDESLEVRWWPLHDLPDLEPAMHELIAIARRRFA
jgi:8-oxo-dGTP pyrophosphatase MutT (NUDIX family)